MTAPNDIDPFANDKAPSLSFKDKPIGTTYTGTVTEAAKMVQSRNYETGEPDFWPVRNPGETPNPKMSAVVRMTLNDTGDEVSVWAQKPSSLFAAIGEAQKVAGARIAVGGTLSIRYVADKPNENPRLNPAKQYAAQYTPPAPGAGSDPWGPQSETATSGAAF